jgi:hypothetical protein
MSEVKEENLKELLEDDDLFELFIHIVFTY